MDWIFDLRYGAKIDEEEIMRGVVAIVVCVVGMAGIFGSAQAAESSRDCPDCPLMVTVPAGSFQMGSSPSGISSAVSEGREHPGRNPATRCDGQAVRDVGHRGHARPV